VTAFLFGMSMLGAQIPLSTFARSDPAVAGYGLGADASFVSTLVGLYVVFLAIGAFTLPLTSRLLGPRNALVGSCLLVALGYALWLPFHDSTGQALLNMAVAGLGSGALVAALPATAAAAAPPERTGFATGMTKRDQDRRRRDRLVGLRDRAGLGRFDRGSRGGSGPAVRLSHRLVDLCGRRAAGCAGAPHHAEPSDPAAPAFDDRVGAPRGGSSPRGCTAQRRLGPRVT
jgi:hypothetical protein